MAELANASVLIISRPGRMRDGLRALIRAIPNLTIAGQVDDCNVVLQLIAQGQPDLLLFGSNLPLPEVEQILYAVKTRWPGIRCVVLMDNIEQLLRVRAAGADSVLLAGFSSNTFFSTVEQLLLPQQV